MENYSVTYTETILREATVEASSPEQAFDRVRAEREEAEHHHAVDLWYDDLEAKPASSRPPATRLCFECGERRE